MDMPQMTFLSNTSLNELTPQHNDNTLEFQKLHPELERWAIFRSLPALLNYDKKIGELLKNIQTGLVTPP
jgi:hypothetical protein